MSLYTTAKQGGTPDTGFWLYRKNCSKVPFHQSGGTHKEL